MKYIDLAKIQGKNNQNLLFAEDVADKTTLLREALDIPVNKSDSKKQNQKKDNIFSSAFKKWFGDWERYPWNASKVIDSDGKPLLVYHGTDADEFSVFDTTGKFTGKSTGLSEGTGAYFTTNRKAAETFGNRIYEVYLNIRKPYIYQSKDMRKDTKKMDQIVRDVKAGKKGKGYDGVIFKNVIDAKTLFNVANDTELKSDVYVIFNPNQVKAKNSKFGTDSDNIYQPLMEMN